MKHLLSMLKSVVLFFFRILWWIESLKEQHLFEIEIFCDFTSTFDQFKILEDIENTKIKKTFKQDSFRNENVEQQL